MYKAFNKTKAIRKYTEDLTLHTVVTSCILGRKKTYIYVVGAKIVTPRVKQIDTPICFLQKQFGNFIFDQKKKYSDMLDYMCTKPCSGPIISQRIKYMTGFRLYPTSDAKHYQLMRLHEFAVNNVLLWDV